MDKDLTTLEVIGVAIRSEEDAGAFYKKIAGAIHNELVKAKYEGLAHEEMKHRAILLGLYHKLTGEKKPPEIPGKPLTAEGGFPISINDMEGALRFAIAREQEANLFYKKAAENADDRSAADLLAYLSDLEKGHELMLTKELESYLRDRDWYANNPDIQLVG